MLLAMGIVAMVAVAMGVAMATKKTPKSSNATGNGNRGWGIKMDKKNVHSRAYHRCMTELVNQGYSKDEAKPHARARARQAVLDLEATEAA